MNNYLSAFPFHNDPAKLSACDCSGQGFDPPDFKLYSIADRLPTFVLHLPPIGANPDLSYANECIRVLTCAGASVASITMLEAGIQILKDASSYWIVYDGRKIPGLKLTCGECYKIKIASYYSEVFYITDTPGEKVQLEFANKGQLGDVPYQTNFVQKLLIDGEVCALDAELFETRKSEANGKETISYQRLTYRKQLFVYQVPDFVTELLNAIPMHDSFKIVHRNETHEALKKRARAEPVRNGCCDYDVTVTVPTRDDDIIGGVCQSGSDSTLSVVPIPANLPDSCETPDDYKPTAQVLCLKFGEVPPPINTDIPPIVTPPVTQPCPPAGFVVSEIAQTAECANAFISNGAKFKKKVTKQIAKGDCTVRTEVEYLNPCDTVVTVSHEITSANCDTITTPPVVTPPVVSPPPASGGTGYPEKFEFLLGTTGYGFDSTAQHGIANEWIERIEAFNYSWGWGITGIAVWINWDTYEPTPGNFQTATLQRIISYCDARKLSLSVWWGGRRNQNDGFVKPEEMIRGSKGTLYLEGSQIYPGYGCDRTNALMTPAIKSVASILKTYSRAFYMGAFGGTAGEQVGHLIGNGTPNAQIGDFSADNLARFNTWVAARGIATPGTPPVVYPENNQWPYPDFSQPRGLEYSRYVSYTIRKYYKNLVDAVKSVSNIPCVYMYAAADNLQLRSTGNANLNWIAAPGDGMYSSDGDGIYSVRHKLLSNSINLGTFPNGLSMQEIDPDDVSTYKYDHNGVAPPYGQANPQYAVLKSTLEQLYARGMRAGHTAMSFSPDEIRGMSGALQQLAQTYIGKPYVRPVINAANTVVLDVVQKSRAGEPIAEGIDPNTKFIKYTDTNFFGVNTAI